MMADVGFLSANENLDGLSYISLVCKRKFGIPKFWFADHFSHQRLVNTFKNAETYPF